jgi:hypothetical protein
MKNLKIKIKKILKKIKLLQNLPRNRKKKMIKKLIS